MTHAVPPYRQSRFEMMDENDFVTYDPERAHEAAGDPGWKRRIADCAQCVAKAVAKAEAGEALPKEGEEW